MATIIYFSLYIDVFNVLFLSLNKTSSKNLVTYRWLKSLTSSQLGVKRKYESGVDPNLLFFEFATGGWPNPDIFSIPR